MTIHAAYIISKPDVCVWELVGTGPSRIYKTSCGNSLLFGIVSSQWETCPFSGCGRKIEVKNE